MAKSKPIGVRFDLEKLELIKKEQNLKSTQAVLNYLMDNYGETETKRGAPFKNMPPYDRNGVNSEDKPKLVQIPVKPVELPKNEPKEGTMAWYLKNS